MKRIKGYLTPVEVSRLFECNDKWFYRKRTGKWYKKLGIREIVINEGRGDFVINRSDLIKNKAEILRFHKKGIK